MVPEVMASACSHSPSVVQLSSGMFLRWTADSDESGADGSPLVEGASAERFTHLQGLHEGSTQIDLKPGSKKVERKVK